MKKWCLSNPLYIVKDYEMRKLLWQSGGGYWRMQTIFEISEHYSRRTYIS